MLIVSNTSPLTNLAAIDQFHLLQELFGDIHIASGVWTELNAGGHPHPGSQEVEAANWIHRHSVKEQPLVRALSRDLDTGESETLALAVERKASLVLIDEREGRRMARRLGLRSLGVLGILLLSKDRGFVAEIRPLLVSLRSKAGFYLSDSLVQRVLERAGEA